MTGGTEEDAIDEMLVKISLGRDDGERIWGDRWPEFVSKNKDIPMIVAAKAAIQSLRAEARLKGERLAYQAVADSLAIGGVKLNEKMSVSGFIENMKAQVRLVDEDLAALGGKSDE